MIEYKKLEIGGKEFYLFTSMEYEKNENNQYYEVQTLAGYGAITLLNNFLNLWLGFEETIEDTNNNTSGLRDGNRIDIHDNYPFSEMLGLDTNGEKWEISYLWITKNGTAFMCIYNATQDDEVGFIELPNL